MDTLQAIYAGNRLFCDALEQAEPVLRRLCAKLVERLGRGGRIFCLSPAGFDAASCGFPAAKFIPVEVSASDTSFDQAWAAMQQEGVSAADIVLALDDEALQGPMAAGLRAAGRRGLLTALITCRGASPLSSAASQQLCLAFEPVRDNLAFCTRLAQRAALGALLCMVLEASGTAGSRPKAESDGSSAADKAAATLMRDCPSLSREQALELIQKYGTVKRAKQAL